MNTRTIKELFYFLSCVPEMSSRYTFFAPNNTNTPFKEYLKVLMGTIQIRATAS